MLRRKEFLFNIIALFGLSLSACATSKEATSTPTCGDVQAQIFDSKVTTSDPLNIFSRDPVYYVVGDTVDVELSIPKCTFIAKAPGFPPANEGEGPDSKGSLGSAKIISDVDQENNRHLIKIRIPIPSANIYKGQGLSYPVEILVSNQSETSSANYGFFLTPVLEIGSTAKMIITEAELNNSFLVSLYENFGDSNRYINPNNSDHPLYNLSYNYSKIKIADDGIYFFLKFKMQIYKDLINNACDPTITSTGRFHIAKGMNTTVEVVWDDGPATDANFPLLCTPTVGLLTTAELISRFLIETNVDNSLKGMFKSGIEKQFDCDNNPCIAITKFELSTGELNITIEPFWPDRVTIAVPYNSDRILNEPEVGFRIRNGSHVRLFSNGLVTSCANGEDQSENCANQKSSPLGLFNWKVNPPIPDPYILSPAGVWGYIRVRDEARKNLTGFSRERSVEMPSPFPPKSLPIPDSNVGALIASYGENIFMVGKPCGINIESQDVSLLTFGVNDYKSDTGKELGSGSYYVTLVWETKPVSEDASCLNH